MFDVNNDDMDQLFRDASENYPLKTEDAANWDKVFSLLQSDEGTELADAGPYKKEKKRKVIFWWLLLLPIGWTGYYSFQKMDGSGAEKKITNKTHETGTSALNSKAKRPNSENIVRVDDIRNSTRTDANENKNSAAHVTAKPSRSGINIEPTMNKLRKKETKTIPLLIPGTEIGQKYKNAFSKNEGIKNSKKISPNDNMGSGNSIKGEKLKVTGGEIVDKTEKNKDAVKEPVDKYADGAQDQNADIISKKKDDTWNNTIKKNADVTAKKSGTVSQAANTKQPTKTIVKLKKDFHFYGALMAGVDLSTVKFQSTNGIGYSIGLLLGYHFSKSRLSVETGIYWDMKKYYSKGDYIDKSKLPSNWQNDKLLYVDGNCNMFEIPVNVRYNVLQKKNTTYFAVFGLSSYIMNKENYGYQVEDPSNGYQWNHYYSYYHSTQNWFSVMNLSVGYEHKLGRIGDIRIEPYSKLPVSGVGKLSLSVMSIGLNVGLSKRF